MPAEIIDGKKVAEEMRIEMIEEIKRLQEKYGRTPRLDVILVGENPASQVYVRNKENTCKNVGIESCTHRLEVSTPEADLLKLIDELNKDDSVDGILVQLPLPNQIDEQKVLNLIRPDKDVDGFHPVNVGKLVVGEKAFRPCTPAGIIELLARSGTKIDGADAVVVGRSNIVGKPVALMLIQKAPNANATVTIVHTRTKNMAEHTRRADILIVAAGKPRAVTADMVKPGATVIDVGVNRLPDGKICGDVDFEAVKEVAGKITPVPGGVGPMTITMLMHNTIEAAKMHWAKD